MIPKFISRIFGRDTKPGPPPPEPKDNFPSEKWGVGDLAVALVTMGHGEAKVEKGNVYRVSDVWVGLTIDITKRGVGLQFEGQPQPYKYAAWNALFFRKVKLSHNKADTSQCRELDDLVKRRVKEKTS